MRGHWLSTTRKLNRHYQSGTGGGGKWDDVDYTTNFTAEITGLHYVGGYHIGKYRFRTLDIIVENTVELRYYPNVLYSSVLLDLQDLQRRTLTVYPYADDPNNPSSIGDIICPTYGTAYNVWLYDNGVWTLHDTFTADFSNQNNVYLYGFSNTYGFFDVEVCVYAATAPVNYYLKVIGT